jgi:hypothetical protein
VGVTRRVIPLEEPAAPAPEPADTLLAVGVDVALVAAPVTLPALPPVTIDLVSVSAGRSAEFSELLLI